METLKDALAVGFVVLVGSFLVLYWGPGVRAKWLEWRGRNWPKSRSSYLKAENGRGVRNPHAIELREYSQSKSDHGSNG